MPAVSLPDDWEAGRPFQFSGVQLVDIDLDAAVRSLEKAARNRRAQGLHLCNAYTLTLALGDSTFRQALDHPGAVNLPDGTPVAWFYRAAKRSAARGPVRGPSLMKAALRSTNVRHFLLGGSPEVLADLELAIARQFPEAQLAGSFSPPFREPTTTDIDDFAHRIRQSGADVVWVGLGTPRQDHVIASLVSRVDVVLVGVGAAFDFLSGHKAEAPAFLHRTGLEWLYRLAQEPRRLWRRYLVGNTLFLVHAARQLVGGSGAGEGDTRTVVSVDDLPRVTVGAASVHCVTETEAQRLVLAAAARRDGRPWLVVTPNIQHVALLEKDAGLRRAYARADLVLADGWPVVRAVRLLSGRRVHRVTGADLLPALSEHAASRGLRIGIVGGMDGAAAEAAQRLKERFPGLGVALTLEPAMGFDRDPAQVARVVEQVGTASLDILFLALGAPKQETFAVDHLEEMNAGVTLCVGAAVDFVAGRQRRAPLVLRRLGLEWFHRALQEPRRLVPRYAQSAPVFVRAVARSWRVTER